MGASIQQVVMLLSAAQFSMIFPSLLLQILISVEHIL